MSEGRVILVGAGPGDPELLTLKAIRALKSADVVLHDALVSQEIIDFANPSARIIAVGKRGGCPSTPQAFIEQLMIREARGGAIVVRLKGGDPFVFGRGGEEATALHAAGIRVDVVSGITAGIAASAALGVPLTVRTHAHGVAFVTGHGANGTDDAVDWDALARSGVTLVIYMGVASAGRIRARLLDAGMAPTTPVAIVACATRPDERTAIATLADFVDVARAADIASPAVVIVGAVAALAHDVPAFLASRPRKLGTG